MKPRFFFSSLLMFSAIRVGHALPTSHRNNLAKEQKATVAQSLRQKKTTEWVNEIVPRITCGDVEKELEKFGKKLALSGPDYLDGKAIEPALDKALAKAFPHQGSADLFDLKKYLKESILFFAYNVPENFVVENEAEADDVIRKLVDVKYRLSPESLKHANKIRVRIRGVKSSLAKIGGTHCETKTEVGAEKKPVKESEKPSPAETAPTPATVAAARPHAEAPAPTPAPVTAAPTKPAAPRAAAAAAPSAVASVPRLPSPTGPVMDPPAPRLAIPPYEDLPGGQQNPPAPHGTRPPAISGRFVSLMRPKDEFKPLMNNPAFRFEWKPPPVAEPHIGEPQLVRRKTEKPVEKVSPTPIPAAVAHSAPPVESETKPEASAPPKPVDRSVASLDPSIPLELLEDGALLTEVGQQPTSKKAENRLEAWKAYLDPKTRNKALFVPRTTPKTDGHIGDRIDRCIPELMEKDRFADRILYFIDQHSQTSSDGKVVSNNHWSSGMKRRYKIQESPANVNLFSNRLCEASEQSLEHNLKGNTPYARLLPRTVESVKRFVREYNAVYDKAQTNAGAAKLLRLKMMKLTSCLARKESLGDADAKVSRDLGEYYEANLGYRKPAGVNITHPTYESYERDEDGRKRVKYLPRSAPANSLVVGLYQFTPAPGRKSNILSDCIPAWNEMFKKRPQCQLPKDFGESSGDKADLMKLLGSTQQTFNAFCGIHKVQGILYSQANTTDRNRTDLSNRKPSGELKAPEDRCVSLFFGSKSPNHFGPLQNQSRDCETIKGRRVCTDDLEKVMTCVNDGS